MSTHRLDVSGARPLTTILNDPSATVAHTSARAGDDVSATLTGFRELRVSLGPDGGAARIERRRYVRKAMRRENGQPGKVDGEYQYDETLEDDLILVLAGGTFFGRTSNLPDAENVLTEGADKIVAPPYEMTPHTNIVVRRQGEKHYLESGELVEETSIRELVSGTEGD